VATVWDASPKPPPIFDGEYYFFSLAFITHDGTQSGNAPDAFAYNGTLPTGITLNASTGIISGTATIGSDSTDSAVNFTAAFDVETPVASPATFNWSFVSTARPAATPDNFIAKPSVKAGIEVIGHWPARSVYQDYLGSDQNAGTEDRQNLPNEAKSLSFGLPISTFVTTQTELYFDNDGLLQVNSGGFYETFHGTAGSLQTLPATSIFGENDKNVTIIWSLDDIKSVDSLGNDARQSEPNPETGANRSAVDNFGTGSGDGGAEANGEGWLCAPQFKILDSAGDDHSFYVAFNNTNRAHFSYNQPTATNQLVVDEIIASTFDLDSAPMPTQTHWMQLNGTAFHTDWVNSGAAANTSVNVVATTGERCWLSATARPWVSPNTYFELVYQSNYFDGELVVRIPKHANNDGTTGLNLSSVNILNGQLYGMVVLSSDNELNTDQIASIASSQYTESHILPSWLTERTDMSNVEFNIALDATNTIMRARDATGSGGTVLIGVGIPIEIKDGNGDDFINITGLQIQNSLLRLFTDDVTHDIGSFPPFEELGIKTHDESSFTIFNGGSGGDFAAATNDGRWDTTSLNYTPFDLREPMIVTGVADNGSGLIRCTIETVDPSGGGKDIATSTSAYATNEKLFMPSSFFISSSNDREVSTLANAAGFYAITIVSFTGTHTGSSGASVLTDSAANSGNGWVTNDLIGLTISNTTDGSSGTITANTGTTITATLSGGTDDDWDASDAYTMTAAHFDLQGTAFTATNDFALDNPQGIRVLPAYRINIKSTDPTASTGGGGAALSFDLTFNFGYFVSDTH